MAIPSALISTLPSLCAKQFKGVLKLYRRENSLWWAYELLNYKLLLPRFCVHKCTSSFVGLGI